MYERKGKEIEKWKGKEKRAEDRRGEGRWGGEENNRINNEAVERRRNKRGSEKRWRG